MTSDTPPDSSRRQVSTRPLVGRRPSVRVLGARNNLARVIAHVLLVGFSIITGGAFLWVVLNSFKTSSEIVQVPPTFWPVEPTLSNYEVVFARLNFGRYLFNSMFVGVAVTLLTLFTSSLVGYVFAKYRFWAKEQLFLIILGTLMIPFAVVMLPLYLLMGTIGWSNTYQALIIPVSVSSFGIFLMRQFIEEVPIELIESARMAGASEWRIYGRIVLPLARPGLAALGIFAFLFTWDSFLWPLVVINDQDLWTLPLALHGLNSERGTRFDLITAGSVVAVVPMIVVYLVFQRQFIRGISTTGLKG